MILALLILAEGLAYALIPPPPVNQKMGIYDALFASFTEGKCRDCHTPGVPDRHHMLVATGEYRCSDCHPVVTVNGTPQITMVRDCIQCHDNTFNGIAIRRPHHETQDAKDRHCSFCHGNLVDDFDDGHYIPAYNISEVTPDTKYKVINSTTGRKWGGCEACHEQDLTMEPPIAFNNKTHHRLGSFSGFNPPNSSKCVQCHDFHSSQYGSDSVRYCERCHGIRSLHNIQYDSVNTSGTPGSGHTGSTWDCDGCHAWYVPGNIAPGTDVIVPVISSINSDKVFEGEPAVLIIKGSNFVSIGQSSDVVLSDGNNPVTLKPDLIAASEIMVTVPALDKGYYRIYALKNGSVKSNRLSIIVVPKVFVNSVVKNGSKIIIRGSGFGQYDPQYSQFVNVTISYNKKRADALRYIQITNWSDTQVEVTSTDAAAEDIAGVNSIYGTTSAKVIDQKGVPARTPKQNQNLKGD